MLLLLSVPLTKGLAAIWSWSPGAVCQLPTAPSAWVKQIVFFFFSCRLFCLFFFLFFLFYPFFFFLFFFFFFFIMFCNVQSSCSDQSLKEAPLEISLIEQFSLNCSLLSRFIVLRDLSGADGEANVFFSSTWSVSYSVKWATAQKQLHHFKQSTSDFAARPSVDLETSSGTACFLELQTSKEMSALCSAPYRVVHSSKEGSKRRHRCWHELTFRAHLKSRLCN